MPNFARIILYLNIKYTELQNLWSKVRSMLLYIVHSTLDTKVAMKTMKQREDDRQSLNDLDSAIWNLALLV